MNAQIYLMFASPPSDPALKEKLLSIVEMAARNPDRGSEFERSTRDFRNAPRAVLLEKLFSHGYDCIVAVDPNGQFLGMVGFQDHADGSRHSFSYFVPQHLQGRGIGTMLVSTFLETAFKAGIFNVRIYGGNIRKELSDKNDKTMQHLYEEVVLKNTLGLPFSIQPGTDVGWVKLGKPSPTHA